MKNVMSSALELFFSKLLPNNHPILELKKPLLKIKLKVDLDLTLPKMFLLNGPDLVKCAGVFMSLKDLALRILFKNWKISNSRH